LQSNKPLDSNISDVVHRTVSAMKLHTVAEETTVYKPKEMLCCLASLCVSPCTSPNCNYCSCTFTHIHDCGKADHKNQAQSEYKYKHLLTFRIQHYVVIATKSVHRLQICPIVHNWTAPSTTPPSYIWVRAVVWECGEGQTDRQL